MKYITLIIGLLVVGILSVGCGKKLTPEEEALRASVVGEYEIKYESGFTAKFVFLENGGWEFYENGKKVASDEDKWSIVDGEIHVKAHFGYIEVYRFNKDKSITNIARILDGEREDLSKAGTSGFLSLPKREREALLDTYNKIK